MESKETIVRFQPHAKRVRYEAIKPGEFGDISGVVGQDKLDPWAKIRVEPDLQGMVDLIVYWGTGRYQESEFVRAKDEFDSLMGKSFYDESSYHARMGYFLDYFSFMRPVADALTAQGRTPLEDLLENADFKTQDIPPDSLRALKMLREFRHSLFVVEKVQATGIVVRDILGEKEKIFLEKTWQGTLGGYGKNSILQGFIFPTPSGWQLSNGVLEHSQNVRKWIIKKAKDSRKNRDFGHIGLLSDLARRHLNVGRWRHGDILNVYKRDHEAR